MSRVVERVVLVTGASQGIGAAVATRLAEPGTAVFASYLTSREAAECVAEEIGARGGVPHTISLDVTDPEAVAAAFAEIRETYGQLDVLVNNAVEDRSAPLVDQTLEDWRRVLGVKLDGIFLCTQAALPLFAASASASMIAISSFEGDNPGPDFLAYGVAAAGVNAFVKAMALYLPRFGARCNAVCPGPVPTALWNSARGDVDWSAFAEINPMSRNATPKDVAEAVAMLVDDATGYLNGNFVYVNGGNHLRQA